MSLDFKRGAESLAESAKGGGQFAKTHYFSVEDKKMVVVRFLTDHDEWIDVKQHQVVKVQKPKPTDAKSWPDRMGAVCRNAKLASGKTIGEAIAEVMPPDCYICDHLVDGKVLKNPSARGWAWACLREEVIEGGQSKGFKDQTREVAKTDKEGQPTGETYVEKAIVLVNMGHKNFFNTLKGFASHYGTVLDRDYYITREGKETDTDYHIVPANPTPMDLRDDAKMKERYGKTRQEFNDALAEEVASRASDSFYARFFDPRFDVDKDDKVRPSGQAPPPAGQPAPPVADANEAQLAALQQRVAGYSVGAAPASDGPPPTAAPAAPPAAPPTAPPPAANGAGAYAAAEYD